MANIALLNAAAFPEVPLPTRICSASGVGSGAVASPSSRRGSLVLRIRVVNYSGKCGHRDRRPHMQAHVQMQDKHRRVGRRRIDFGERRRASFSKLKSAPAADVSHPYEVMRL
jgi:hypothetical protein